MASKFQQQNGRDGSLSKLNVAIEALNLTKELSSVAPAKAVFGLVSVLLTMIRDSMANEQDHVELGLNCHDVCKALARGLNGRHLDDLSQSVFAAIEDLTTNVAEIQKNIIKQSKRNAVSRFLRAKDDKQTIVVWRQNLNRILHTFNTELLVNNHMILLDIRQNTLAGQESIQSTQASVPPGELPPPAPRTCFGRGELIETLISYAEILEPIALIGAGGIGKTAIALTLLHHDHIKDRFGHNRRFIRCDRFPPSRAHFLAQLSKVIGADVENPEDLTSLRPFLSSREILIVLDNAESVLDPQGTEAQEIYGMVDELCQSKTICLCITSRLTTVPRHCKRPEIPTLSVEAARDIFYTIHDDSGTSGIVDDLLRHVDFHALSITLLATTASHNVWDYDELAKEWDTHRAQVLRTDYNESLAATIELSLASPTFLKLGAHARDLLGVVAFFPQGVDERNLDSFFPTTSDRKNIFNKFRLLSLTHRSNGFIMMLAPIRDYFCPKDPKASPLLCAVRSYYFSRLSIDVNPSKPGFEEAQWIISEDLNVEHLVNVFTSIDTNTVDVWNACAHFMRHIYWHKKRPTILGPKIKNLPDDHPSKPKCLSELSWLYRSVGNYREQQRLLSHVLRLARVRGDEEQVALTLKWLSDTTRLLTHYEDGIRQVKEALEIYERLGDTVQQASCLIRLARLLHSDKQPDAAEEAGFRAIKLLPEKGEEFLLCLSYRVLGEVCLTKSKREKAIHYFKTSLGLASTFNWPDQLFCVHRSLAEMFLDGNELRNAQNHTELAKSHTVEGTYDQGAAMVLQARIWFRQSRLGDARSQVLGALEIFEKLGASDAGTCRDTLHTIEQAMKSRSTSRNHFLLAIFLLLIFLHPVTRRGMGQFFGLYPDSVARRCFSSFFKLSKGRRKKKRETVYTILVDF